MLLCDACGLGWHTHCVNLPAVPDGFYVCPQCNEKGITTLTVEMQRREQGLLPAAWDSSLASSNLPVSF